MEGFLQVKNHKQSKKKGLENLEKLLNGVFFEKKTISSF